MKRWTPLLLGWMALTWGWMSTAQAEEHGSRIQGEEVQATSTMHHQAHEQNGRQKHERRSNDHETQNHTTAPSTASANGGGNTAPPSTTPTFASTPTVIPLMDITVEALGPQTPVALGLASATDNSGIPLVVSSDAPTLFGVGTTTVTYSATDAAGNTATATQTVTVVDTTPPVIVVPPSVTTEATGPTSPVLLGSVTAQDLVDGTIAVSNDAPPLFPVGTTTVTYTATDLSGNSTSVIQLVTVVDSTPPALTIPPDIVAEANNVLSSVALGSATATDMVDGSVTVSVSTPSPFPLGTTTVTYTANDASGNSTTATQLVTVRDTTPPTVLAPPASTIVSADGTAVSVALRNPLGSDIFGPVQWSNDAPNQFAVGDTVVTWTARDANGNTAATAQTVTVVLASTPSTSATNLPGDTMSLPPTVLPPDPGAAGRATLEGIDSDGDGVRDDVQIWIETNYPNSLKIRMALRQEAMAFQKYLRDSHDPDLTFQNLNLSSRASSCLLYITPDFYKIDRKLEAIILNTILRSKALILGDSHLSGMILSGYDGDDKSACDFNPDLLEN